MKVISELKVFPIKKEDTWLQLNQFNYNHVWSQNVFAHLFQHAFGIY